jgi:hypothetical protein
MLGYRPLQILKGILAIILIGFILTPELNQLPILKQMSVPWTPEGALLSFTGEGRCAQIEAMEHWLSTLLQNLDQMIASCFPKFYQKIQYQKRLDLVDQVL